ncbi:MAG TPA: DNA glycosylase [Ruminiclostridium sp.]|nr:DNA glycosylase [Ruminiclostridium sp.]
MNIKANKIETDTGIFDPDVTFDCGQCFRWEKSEDGTWNGIVNGRVLTVEKSNGKLMISGGDELMIRQYFDLDRDYNKVIEALSGDPVLDSAIKFAPGIRILRQKPWEALCSFIISQNNNIPRIKGIISRLCENFGEKIGENAYSFPAASKIAVLSALDLAPLRSGFRAAYIIDAAKLVSSGEIDFTALSYIPLNDARKTLMRIKGVGPKVADCALLFGCGRLDAFPIDVWVKRVLARFYPEGFPQVYMQYGGIAQQFLFHYARCCPESGF